MLGRYRLLERLGAGGFGVVWRAHDEQLDREVALKRIPLPNPEDSERATREALASARLCHPAIVSLYEACSDGDAFYLISELVHGQTLARLIERDELDDEQILQVGIAVASALAHAHGRGVIHRDIKPPNVIVLAQAPAHGAIAKLADFGGARLAGEQALTRTGDVLGTLAYMAPEQSEGREVGSAADVYSLALVMYEAFSGINPVRGSTPAATARRIGSPIEPLERRRRDLSRALARTIDAALEPDPRTRATLDELRESLEDARGGGSRRRRIRATGREQLDADEFAEQLDAGELAEHARPAGELPKRPHEDDEPPGRSCAGDEPVQQPHKARFALPRPAWFVVLVALAVWQALLGRPGVSLLVLAGGAPLLLARRWTPQWAAAALAPALGMIGLAGAFPALAGQGKRFWERMGIAALGLWWVALAEPLVGRLWEGPPAGLPARTAWEGSLALSATHALTGAVSVQLLIGMGAWAAAAAILPWIVRGRNAALDVAAAATWTVALLAIVPLLQRSAAAHAAYVSPRGALLGGTLGCLLAVCARALRGPVCP